jgi:FAD/FMN-containing dehydrogenase
VTDQPDQADARPAKVARDAALQSRISNLVYLAIMLGVTLAITKRDWIGRQVLRFRSWQSAAAAAESRAVAELRRELSELEHGGMDL